MLADEPTGNLDEAGSDARTITSVPYWEGPVTISGNHSGTGYPEMTGYDE